MNPEEIDKLKLFISSIKKVSLHRVHKINNSLGVYDAYKYIRKNKWFDIGLSITEHLFYTIIRNVNKLLAKELSEGSDINLPLRMGRLELRKYSSKVSFNKGKLISNLPIDWNKTIRLWYEDLESYKNKTLIKMEEKEIFKIYYNKLRANYNNKSFYQFSINRNIKIRLKENINKGIIDAFKFK